MKLTENSEMLMLTWDILGQYIKESSKQSALDHVVSDLVDNGFLDEPDLSALMYFGDAYLKKSANPHLDDDGDEEEYEDDVV